MPRRRMRVVEAEDYTFYFTYDRRRISEVHIETRAGVRLQTAIDTFFQGMHGWNDHRNRFECYTETHGLYWTWLYGDETSSNVLVISCFPLEEDEWPNM
jgi:hypothetical protein